MIQQPSEYQLANVLLAIKASDYPEGLKALVLQRDGHACQICGEKENVAVCNTRPDLSRDSRYMLTLCQRHQDELSTLGDLKLEYDAYMPWKPGVSYPLLAYSQDELVPHGNLHYYKSRDERMGEHAHALKNTLQELSAMENASCILQGMYYREMRNLRLYALEGYDPADLSQALPVEVREKETWARFCERVFGKDVNTTNEYIRDAEVFLEGGVLEELAERKLKDARWVESVGESAEEGLKEAAQAVAFATVTALPHSTRVELIKANSVEAIADLTERAHREHLSSRAVKALVQEERRKASGLQLAPSCFRCVHRQRIGAGKRLTGLNGKELEVREKGLDYCELYGYILTSMTPTGATTTAEGCTKFKPEGEE